MLVSSKMLYTVKEMRRCEWEIRFSYRHSTLFEYSEKKEAMPVYTTGVAKKNGEERKECWHAAPRYVQWFKLRLLYSVLSNPRIKNARSAIAKEILREVKDFIVDWEGSYRERATDDHCSKTASGGTEWSDAEAP